MRQQSCVVRNVRQVADNIFVLMFDSPEIAAEVRPGQFVNIKVDDGTDPLLRRPFSVYRVNGTGVEIIFHVIGRGTAALRRKREGERLDILGPLGVPFNLHDSFETAVLVAGGLGVAPLPITTEALKRGGKRIITLLGARTAGALAEHHLEHTSVATDDGSRGFHGTVVDLLRSLLTSFRRESPKIFGCGPTAMLRGLADLAISEEIPCEVSLEGPMGCGFGICQGCPVELVDGEKQYALMCKDGPAFDVRRIRI